MQKLTSKLIIFSSLFLGSLGLPTQVLALSPPWIVYQNQVKAALSVDSCVKVNRIRPVTVGYALDLLVCDSEKAHALATLLKSSFNFGGVKVEVQVYDPFLQLLASEPSPTEPEELAKLIHTAFIGNPYFVGFVQKTSKGLKRPYAEFILFSGSVLQYWGDNLADYKGNVNRVAADVFHEIMDLGKFQGLTTNTVSQK